MLKKKTDVFEQWTHSITKDAIQETALKMLNLIYDKFVEEAK